MPRERRLIYLSLLLGVILFCVGILLWNIRESSQDATPIAEADITESEEQKTEPDRKAAPEPTVVFDALSSRSGVAFDEPFLQSYLKENGTSEKVWVTVVVLSSGSDNELKHLAKALQQHPESVVLNSLAAFQEMFGNSLGSPDGSAIDRLIALDPSNGLGWFLSSLSAFGQDRAEDGIADFVRAGQSNGVHLFANEVNDIVGESLTEIGYSKAESLMIAGDKASIFTSTFPRANETARLVIEASREHTLRGEPERAMEINQAGFDLGRHFMDASGMGEFDLILDLIGAMFVGKFSDEIDFDQLPSRYQEESAWVENYVSSFKQEMPRMQAGLEHISEADYLKYTDLLRVVGWQITSDLMGW